MSPETYKEQDFEEHIEQNLLAAGYHKRLPEEYDRDLCLIPDEVILFIQTTQPKEYERLEGQYGADTPAKLCFRISQEITRHGSLHVLRKGVTDRGIDFRLTYPKPTSGMNPEHMELYKGMRLSVVRQLKYSKRNENSIDMVLFVNGIPIVTAELKNSLTGQFVEDAIKQYKNDRDPKEPLLQFKRCLVHFAIGSEKVFMATKLEGDNTFFLPFNKDIENPVNPEGHKTAYLWQDILRPDTLLELIENYLLVQKRSEKIYDARKNAVVEKESEVMLFPRYHQLDCVRTILDAVGKEGVGRNYLVQHSAGSGKSNTISWLAHHLAGFYQKETDKARLFDSIIVVTDRRILDKQLRNNIKQFERTKGVVAAAELGSFQLREALEGGKDIIVTTLQKFPLISKSMGELKAKRYAVIIDEAHSGQSGESAKHLKKVLTAKTLEDAAEEEAKEEEFDLEDRIVEEIKTRGRQPNISYFAFTATPKNKTIELFGREKASFHTYSMRQAIEEKFILDVLENYTTFERYFKLSKKVPADNEYEKKKAIRLLTSYVDLLPHAIDRKTGIVLDHFLEKTYGSIQGRGRAMVVTRSRLHAVKYYLHFSEVLQKRKLPFRALVAFSGEVKDPDTKEKHTENGLNQLPQKVSIEDAFKTPEYRILIVAEKFQTGFDEPLLHTMYVDKKLENVHAVQTLSRLNRTMRGKDGTMVLDFVNEAKDIQKAFQFYYQKTFLEDETDPNKLYDLKQELAAFDIYRQEDINDFAAVFFDEREPQEKQQPILDRVVHQWNDRSESEKEEFKGTLQSYIRFYGFISQIITFKDIELEKLYVFARNLNRKLPKGTRKLPWEVVDAVDLSSFRIQQTFQGKVGLKAEDGLVPGMATVIAIPSQGEKDFLSNIIKTLNDTYALNLTEEDKVDIGTIRQKVHADEELKAVFSADNTLENKQFKFYEVLNAALLNFVESKTDLYKKLSDQKVNPLFKQKMFDEYYKGYKAEGVEQKGGSAGEESL
jgi:type I restriction enzyme, R subunit